MSVGAGRPRTRRRHGDRRRRLGGVALASLGGFGVISATTLVVVAGVAWLIDQRRGRTGPERSSNATSVE